MLVLYLTNCAYVGSVMRDVRKSATGSTLELESYCKRINGWILDIHELLEKNPHFEDMWALVQRADGVVYVYSPEQHLHGKVARHLEVLRADLIAAGRDPDTFPVVFQVLRLDYDSPIASEEEIAPYLSWPFMDRFDSVVDRSAPAEERELDLPLKRLVDMIESGP